MNRIRLTALTAVLTATVLSSPALITPAGADTTDTPVTAKDRAAAAYAAAWEQHPGDYMALERAVTGAGGDSLRFNVPSAGLKGATAAQVTRAQSTKDVPTDAFQVSGAWYHVQDQYGEWWSASGQWNFRDDYVNGSAPDDASGVAIDEVDKKCWENDGDLLHAADYQNNFYDKMWRHSASTSTNVWNIRDAVSGFVMKADHGTHMVHLRRVGYKCENDDKMAASYHYEHNQDGDGGWGVSITIGVMSLSYNGSAGTTMQKSTNVFYNK